ncbi:MAG: hypothetical protein HOO06_05665 [Bdellovibrionaceae bacterium]|jgi:hypothetical protein|nr:hypothetical protein [Pseudobdellovibrionaceae bacterium]
MNYKFNLIFFYSFFLFLQNATAYDRSYQNFVIGPLVGRGHSSRTLNGRDLLISLGADSPDKFIDPSLRDFFITGKHSAHTYAHSPHQNGYVFSDHFFLLNLYYDLNYFYRKRNLNKNYQSISDELINKLLNKFISYNKPYNSANDAVDFNSVYWELFKPVKNNHEALASIRAYSMDPIIEGLPLKNICPLTRKARESFKKFFIPFTEIRQSHLSWMYDDLEKSLHDILTLKEINKVLLGLRKMFIYRRGLCFTSSNGEEINCKINNGYDYESLGPYMHEPEYKTFWEIIEKVRYTPVSEKSIAFIEMISTLNAAERKRLRVESVVEKQSCDGSSIEFNDRKLVLAYWEGARSLRGLGGWLEEYSSLLGMDKLAENVNNIELLLEAHNNNLAGIKLAIEGGANILAVGNSNRSVLNIMSAKGNLQAIRYLLSLPQRKMLLKHFGFSSLNEASKNGHQQIKKEISDVLDDLLD